MVAFRFCELPQQKRLPRKNCQLNRADVCRDSATKWQNVSGRAAIFITLQMPRHFLFAIHTN
jgi:hypothetical protein